MVANDIGTSAAKTVTTPVPWRAVYSPREAEQILGISHSMLYRLINAGRLDARKLDGKTVITRASIERLIDELPPAVAQAVPR